jgi:hypothetical protein
MAGIMNVYTLLILPVIVGFAAWYFLGNFKSALFVFALAVAGSFALHLFRR